jgi:hypothetical protein
MAWEISWLNGTREQLAALVHAHFPKFPIKEDFGQVMVQEVEKEIRLHPLPGRDLPQVAKDEVLRIGPIQVSYHIDSLTGHAEVRSVKLL